MYAEMALAAYIIDRLFGEFKFIRHPIVLMGDYIHWFENKFYEGSTTRGFLLTFSLLTLVFLTIFSIQNVLGIGDFSPAFGEYFSGLKPPIPEYIHLLFLSIIASTTIASNMLYNSVKDIIDNPSNIKYLVSRDTEHLSHSDINKAAIETYAENLSDGVIAPLFYLLFFGLYGAFIYKAINTLDSMVGYRNKRYARFGKFAARLDDVVNYIPARITAILIALCLQSKKALKNFYRYGKHHSSPNAGHPIAAMALAIDVKLGGDTSYHGSMKLKPYFGDGHEEITIGDIHKALNLQPRLDIVIITLLSVGVLL